MAQTGRPLSPHLQVYKWQVQMASSILHRATGIILAVGSLLIVWGLAALAAGQDAFATFTACATSLLGTIVMIGWTLAFFYHLCNGIRHLVQDTGKGYAIESFVRSSWMAIIVSIVLTVAVWAYVLTGGHA
ncbi:succinate dehydrogenase, cytochrome b556 subunit [Luteibacter rhizovicinus DSM 16549]|jgi:succinate dehydrogenase / fumarate reductase cytochrome b subunit|uniref:Succinate dehydrogenase cytochrome b556 subunit n=1 Tax=Luteibacter rhizovicinus DSM 16549 TaxID=1440763 RepID=A0A0G9HE18_9GAMM|nr:succinate dehydrogenase, cytochrome b556 subunit [Luteibacter rhizovicinus]APG05382.1 succinate dehydrogenase, cytochrome b556 subunit [Luteibacter rhizovicinus DSM 16549]KLD68000.1 succinate dehydrogenase [Luteibacter rhizovicinus DSM 16549]KLD75677.1 succinate dehydrogenase [Xanthomonas hyacinthi DSM 19077]